MAGLWSALVTDAGLVFLGAGVFRGCLELVILQRLRSCGELPAVLRTSPSIQLAPALVACAPAERQWREGDTLAKMLFGYGLLQLLFMLRLMPRIYHNRLRFFLEFFVRRFRAGDHGVTSWSR